MAGSSKFKAICWTILLAALAGGAGWWLYLQNSRREVRYDSQIQTAANRYRVHPALIKAVVWRESAFDETAKGAAGELGLMQIRWMAAKDWATSESLPWHSADFLRDPGTNTLVGTWYLSRLLQRYSRTDNPLPYALADYNAGRSNVLRWAKGEASTNSQEFMRQITFPGTRKYILTISARMKIYQRQFETAAFAQAQ